MKHKERPTATLILCVIIGAVIFSEFTPAALFESDSLRKTSNKDFARIKGQATAEVGDPEGCHCKGKLCDEMGNEHCVWNRIEPEDPLSDEGYCSGCEGPERLTARFGDEMMCYSGDTPNSERLFGCCADACKDLGCPAPCEARYLIRVGQCNETYPSECIKIACYEIRTDI